MDKNQINESFLAILKIDPKSKVIVLDTVPIENLFKAEIEKFHTLASDVNSSLEDIMSFLNKTPSIEQLNDTYQYCKHLGSAFQRFTVNISNSVEAIKKRKELMLLNKKNNPEKYDLEENVKRYKLELHNDFITWTKAYSIKRVYKRCSNDPTILTFSHRIDGWADPFHKLNNDFSIQLKTNFGFGGASYFYTIIKYKNIEITPFSEWIEYEFANFSEIVRYTQSYLRDNSEWLEALTYARDACNVSIKSESEFVKKYIIDECEVMVKGLEEIFNKENFSFKKRDHSSYVVDKRGHALVDFRGEKISGALEFISKILEFKGIIEIQSFIQRIERCNSIIQPMLVNEIIEMLSELNDLNQEMSVLKPKYEESQKLYSDFMQKKNDVRAKMTLEEDESEYQFSIRVNLAFHAEYPEFNDFNVEHDQVSKEFRLLSERITNLMKVLESIKGYNEKITNYFKSKAVLVP